MLEKLKNEAWSRVTINRLNDLMEQLRPFTNLRTDNESPLQILPDSNGVYIGLDVAALAAQNVPGLARDYSYYHALNYSLSYFNTLYYSSAMVPTVSAANAPQTIALLGNGDVCATPFVTMSGGNVSKIAFELTQQGSVVGEKVVLGIYSNTADTTLYPKNLVVQGSEFNVNTSPSGLCVSTVSATLSPGALYWLVFFANSVVIGGNAKMAVLMPSQLFPIIGMGSVAWSNAGQGAGGPFGGLASTFANLGISYSPTLPNPFPAGATPGVAVGSYAPLIGVAFSS